MSEEKITNEFILKELDPKFDYEKILSEFEKSNYNSSKSKTKSKSKSKSYKKNSQSRTFIIGGTHLDEFYTFLNNDLDNHLINSNSPEELDFKTFVRDKILSIYGILKHHNKLENVFNDPQRYLDHLQSDQLTINNESNKLKIRLLKIFYIKIIQFKNRQNKQNSSRKSRK